VGAPVEIGPFVEEGVDLGAASFDHTLEAFT
jgi:hypothetical protein